MEELYHYGVLGMKWGIRRDRVSETFGKASAKANKLRSKAVITNAKAARLRQYAFKKEMRAITQTQYQKARNTQLKAHKLQLKSARLDKKAMKWEKSMEKIFAEVKISDIKPEDLKTGKKYAYMLIDE